MIQKYKYNFIEYNNITNFGENYFLINVFAD